jgi:hypothetical protein
MPDLGFRYCRTDIKPGLFHNEGYLQTGRSYGAHLSYGFPVLQTGHAYGIEEYEPRSGDLLVGSNIPHPPFRAA